MSSPKRHVFISLLFILKRAHYAHIYFIRLAELLLELLIKIVNAKTRSLHYFSLAGKKKNSCFVSVQRLRKEKRWLNFLFQKFVEEKLL